MIKRAGIDKLPGLWVLMLVIAVIAGIPRFYWMLTGQYNAVVIIFVVFARYAGLHPALMPSAFQAL